MFGCPSFDKFTQFELAVDAGDDFYAGKSRHFIAFELCVAAGDDYRRIGKAAVERSYGLTAFLVGEISHRA